MAIAIFERNMIVLALLLRGGLQYFRKIVFFCDKNVLIKLKYPSKVILGRKFRKVLEYGKLKLNALHKDHPPV